MTDFACAFSTPPQRLVVLLAAVFAVGCGNHLLLEDSLGSGKGLSAVLADQHLRWKPLQGDHTTIAVLSRSALEVRPFSIQQLWKDPFHWCERCPGCTFSMLLKYLAVLP